MTVLALIGVGQHAVKNILPALALLPEVELRYAVVRSPLAHIEALPAATEIVGDYETVLRDPAVDAVYIATPIASHSDLATRALKADKGVLCEKPMTESLAKTEMLAELSLHRGVRLHEVVMYQHHDQFKEIQRHVSGEAHGLPTRIRTRFQIPHLESSNIRYDPDKAGGALLDVGFYPISALQTLLPRPELMMAHTAVESGYAVDTVGVALYRSESIYGIAEWGIGGEYRNELEVEFADRVVVFERAFSKPADFAPRSTERLADGSETESVVEPSNHFVSMMRTFFEDNQADSEHLAAVVGRARAFDLIRANERLQLETDRH